MSYLPVHNYIKTLHYSNNPTTPYPHHTTTSLCHIYMYITILKPFITQTTPPHPTPTTPLLVYVIFTCT